MSSQPLPLSCPRRRASSIPTIVLPDLVGTFIYNDIGSPFKVEYLDVGHAIDDVDLKGVPPITLVALTAMKYICAKAQYTAPRSYRQVHLPLRLSA
ncbi:MAG: hypothetical protein IKJ76_04855 [Fibrobacter sp.]|nr:hypothetical protein [Fibrobacter sp.]